MTDEKTDPETTPTTPESNGAAPADSSAGSSTGSPFLGNTGPGYTGEAPPGAPDGATVDRGVDPAYPGLSEEQVTSTLKNLGDGAHAVAGVGELDWVMTERDLERIGPPLTRILNRYDPAGRVVGHSDELSLAVGSGLYTWRSLLERKAVLAAQEPEEGEPTIVREPPPAPARAPRDTREPGAASPEGPEITVDPGYQTYADRLRATRPPEAP